MTLISRHCAKKPKTERKKMIFRKIFMTLLLAVWCAASVAGTLIVEAEKEAGVTPTPTMAAPAPVVVVPVQLVWQVRIEDVTLAAVFARWGRDAGVSVRWDVDRHLLIDAPGSHKGSFEEAITQVLQSPGINKGAVPLEVCFYPNNPPLARVTRFGAQKEECK